MPHYPLHNIIVTLLLLIALHGSLQSTADLFSTIYAENGRRSSNASLISISDLTQLKNHSVNLTYRLHNRDDEGGRVAVKNYSSIVSEPDGNICGPEAIFIDQVQVGKYYRHQAYVVTIANILCSDPECVPTDIHAHCGQWYSLVPINPKKFRRIADDDCFIRDGGPLHFGDVSIFRYTATQMFPITFKSARFCAGSSVSKAPQG